MSTWGLFGGIYAFVAVDVHRVEKAYCFFGVHVDFEDFPELIFRGG